MTTTRIELLQPHRHAGRDYPAGAKLSIADRKASWLIGIGVAKEAPAVAPASTPATTPATQPTTATTKRKE